LIIYMMNEFSTNRNNCDHSNHWSFIVHMNWGPIDCSWRPGLSSMM
jgi:hypothetical protein